MGVGRAKVGVPRVEVRVEVDERHRAVPGRSHPEEGQGDGVVATDGHEGAPVARQRPRRVLDLLEGLGNAKRGARHVARVDDLDGGKGLHVEVRVIGAHQARGLAHGLRPETCSRTVGGPGVKGNAEDRDVPRLHLPDPG